MRDDRWIEELVALVQPFAAAQSRIGATAYHDDGTDYQATTYQRYDSGRRG
jgi:hypothetical protein